MAKISEYERLLLDRHYTKIKIFGWTIYFWNTSPKAVLEHLKELMPLADINTFKN